jgi:hypothetical protein
MEVWLCRSHGTSRRQALESPYNPRHLKCQKLISLETFSVGLAFLYCPCFHVYADISQGIGGIVVALNRLALPMSRQADCGRRLFVIRPGVETSQCTNEEPQC